MVTFEGMSVVFDVEIVTLKSKEGKKVVETGLGRRYDDARRLVLTPLWVVLGWTCRVLMILGVSRRRLERGSCR